jgi:hypothetical protein
MDEAILSALQPSLSARPCRFIDQDYIIVSYRADFVIGPIAGNDLGET